MRSPRRCTVARSPVPRFTAVLVLAGVVFFFLPTSSDAQNRYVSIEDIPPCSYLLVDQATGMVLIENDGHTRMAPASLSKLMTLYLAQERLRANGHDLAQEIVVPAEGAATAMRPGSSLMGLRDGETVSYLDLLRGAAVASGNDAAWSLAVLTAGDAETFIESMNRRAQTWGLSSTRYTDPDGWSELSRTTPYDQAEIARRYIADFPEALPLLHDEPHVEWPAGSGRIRKNTNLLVGTTRGVDGLKTGTIPEAGFHFIATAERAGTRLIALVMGIREESMVRGVIARAEAARILLETGFDTWATVRPAIPPLPALRLRRGDTNFITPMVMEEEPVFTLPRTQRNALYVTVDLPEELTAPISADDAVGKAVWWIDGRPIGETALGLPRNIPRLGIWAYIVSYLRGERD